MFPREMFDFPKPRECDFRNSGRTVNNDNEGKETRRLYTMYIFFSSISELNLTTVSVSIVSGLSNKYCK